MGYMGEVVHGERIDCNVTYDRGVRYPAPFRTVKSTSPTFHFLAILVMPCARLEEWLVLVPASGPHLLISVITLAKLLWAKMDGHILLDTTSEIGIRCVFSSRSLLSWSFWSFLKGDIGGMTCLSCRQNSIHTRCCFFFSSVICFMVAFFIGLLSHLLSIFVCCRLPASTLFYFLRHTLALFIYLSTCLSELFISLLLYSSRIS